MSSILIADANEEIRSRVSTHAAFEGMTVAQATDGISALKLFRRSEYDILIIDADIPELDAYNVCRQIRKSSDTPIIIISARNNEDQKLTFYELGADDFVEKPFSGKLIMAHIRVFLKRNRRRSDFEPRRLIFDGLCIDTAMHAVFADGESITLTPKEYGLLTFLAQNPHKALSRETILQNVWGEDFFGTDRTVDTHIKMLREHIKPYGKFIETIWGVGYIFR